jgi:hypothetical protein
MGFFQFLIGNGIAVNGKRGEKRERERERERVFRKVVISKN